VPIFRPDSRRPARADVSDFVLMRAPGKSPRLIQITFQKGIYLPEIDLWLDPPHSREKAFISHAHSDHVGRHREVICTRLTQNLMNLRNAAGRRTQFSDLEYGQTLQLIGFELTALSAGHIMGSAMLHVRRIRDGASLLYTGDYKLRAGLTGQPAELKEADTLIMETTFGLRKYVFPTAAEVTRMIGDFVSKTFTEGGVPILLGYSLGKAQEIVAALRGIQNPVMLHPHIEKVSALLAPHLGPMPEIRAWDECNPRGHVLVLPPHVPQIQSLKEKFKCKVAMVSGWGLDPSAKYRYRTDEVFPLSDHADYPQLIETVERVKPKLIYTVHGFTREFAADLRAKGLDARALGQEEQLDLSL
jgi:DNA ligase 1